MNSYIFIKDALVFFQIWAVSSVFFLFFICVPRSVTWKREKFATDSWIDVVLDQMTKMLDYMIFNEVRKVHQTVCNWLILVLWLNNKVVSSGSLIRTELRVDAFLFSFHPAFNSCCKESGFLMVFKCREENSALKECLTQQWVFLHNFLHLSALAPQGVTAPHANAANSSDSGFLIFFYIQSLFPIQSHHSQTCPIAVTLYLLFSASYQDPAFFEECKRLYIQEKLEFQKTGIPAKNRTQKLPTSM